MLVKNFLKEYLDLYEKVNLPSLGTMYKVLIPSSKNEANELVAPTATFKLEEEVSDHIEHFVLFIARKMNTDFESTNAEVLSDLEYLKQILTDGGMVSLDYIGSLRYFENEITLFPLKDNSENFGFPNFKMTKMKKNKTPKESHTVMTNIVLPNETNALDNMFGGELLARMDRACAIAASRHSESQVVTASVNHVSFNYAIPLGAIVVVEAKVSRAFRSSMEIYVDVWVDDPISKTCTKANEAIYTFVGVDDNHKPIKVPEIQPETDLEKERYEGALRRKQLSLVLSKRMKPEDATELKKLFE